MYINSAYINDSLLYCKDDKHPLSIGSCGNYKLLTDTILPTTRPHGRPDYQLIYIASGIAHFFFDKGKDDTIIPAGTFILFRPKEYQKYIYYGSDKTQVYWIHFSGNNVKDILRQYGIQDNMNIIKTGTTLAYADLFNGIITEIQQRRFGYESMIDGYFKQLLILISRSHIEEASIQERYITREIEAAKHFFSEHYSEDISIDNYASSKGMSVSWFIRSFKEITSKTPLQFILEKRIINACILLESTDHPINEISRIVGYENSLYFSRLFRKQKGISPSEYRKQFTKSEPPA